MTPAGAGVAAWVLLAAATPVLVWTVLIVFNLALDACR